MQILNSLPTGTVTFLFTDIEGSTKLAQAHPDQWPQLQARHHALMHQAIETHKGYVFQIIGDAFCAAFSTAPDALNAAVEAQRALNHEAWVPAPIHVRMGIHTGVAQLQADSKENPYAGYATLALTQRIMSAGHGGQILLSQAVHDLTGEKLPAQAQFVDMGERHLKDVLRPEHLYQLTVPDLPSDFAPLNTLETFNHNLPTQLTSFIGREKEIEEVKRLVNAHRIVTLTGSGGAGKTRLSLQVGAECLNQFSDGVWFVELAPIADPNLVPQTLLAVFSLREDSQRTALQVLTDHLRAKTLLLMLDNCEHLIDSCAKISENLLQACPRIKILASSREALGIAGEVSYRVPSLATPNPDHLPALEKLAELDSIRLFVERATIAKSDFTLTKDNAPFVAQICSRLDGIPLAIELAAARVKVLSSEQIAARLDDRFRLLTGGSRTALPRQQTLRAMIDWSYSLLSEHEKILFRRLAVFVGGWTIEAAEQVCVEEGSGFDVLDLLMRLVDKSLTYVEESTGETRYHRLETIRQYSREKFLETGEVETIRDRHLDFYVQFAEKAEKHLQARERVRWIHFLEAEQDNLRAALEWGLAKNPNSALQIASSMVFFWAPAGYSAEGFRWLQQSLERVKEIGAGEEPDLRAKGLSGLAFLYASLGDNVNAKRVAEASLALCRQSQDRTWLAYSLFVYSYPLELLGELVQAEAVLKESLALARQEKNTYLTAGALSNLTRVTVDLHGDVETATRYADEAIRICLEAGMEWVAATALEMKGHIAAHQQEYVEARALFEQALAGFQAVNANFNVILVTSSLAHLERGQGNYERALDLYRETIVAFRDVAQTGAVAHQLECFGFIALAQDQSERALQLFAAADALREKGGMPMTPDEQAYFDEQLKGVREKVDPTKFDSIWSKGQIMTMERAIEFALEARHG